MLAGCATTDPVAVPCPEPLTPPAPPSEAMVYTPARSILSDDFVSLPLEEALRELLRAHASDIHNLERLEAKHRALVDYIEGVVK